MARWLQANRRTSEALTKPTELPEPPNHLPKAGVPSVLSVLSVLSGVTTVSAEPPAQPDCLPQDALAFLDVLRREGPLTIGAAASALGWKATRAWQAEARLRAAGLARHDGLGRAFAVAGGNTSDDGRTGA